MAHAAESVGEVDVCDIEVALEVLGVLYDGRDVQILLKARAIGAEPALAVRKQSSGFAEAQERIFQHERPQLPSCIEQANGAPVSEEGGISPFVQQDGV
jgi:hypothetical protein